MIISCVLFVIVSFHLISLLTCIFNLKLLIKTNFTSKIPQVFLYKIYFVNLNLNILINLKENTIFVRNMAH